jgi:hypothetical protein
MLETKYAVAKVEYYNVSSPMTLAVGLNLFWTASTPVLTQAGAAGTMRPEYHHITRRTRRGN